MGIINKKELKRIFESKGIKIGAEALRAFSENQREIIEREAEKAVRNARIVGRKVVKKEDFAD